MRTSTLISGAALAAGAFASPLFKRDLEIDTVYDVTYETVYVTETQGVTAAPVAAVATTVVTVEATPATTSSIAAVKHYGHRHSKAASSAPAPVVSSVAPVVSSVAPVVSVAKVVSSAAPVVTSTAEADAAPAGYTSAWTSSWASTWVVTPSAEPTTAVATSAAPAATTQATQAYAAPAGKATTYQEIVLAHHNVHRANHSAPALVWDADLASTASTIAATCVYAHSMNVNGGGYGQNIAAGVEASNVSAVITELFYNGEVNYYSGLYGQANPDMTNFEKWGHFSQLVWKGTTKVGCATQHCPGGLANTGAYVSPYFTVCNYGTPGNYAGEYAENIGSCLNKPTEDWSYNL